MKGISSNKENEDMILSSGNNFFDNNKSSKSHTLKFLSKQIKNSKIEKIYDFTVSEWMSNEQNIVERIQKNLVAVKLLFEALQ